MTDTEGSEHRPSGPILFCFDGSDGSLRALATAAALLAPRAAVVLTVWETVAMRLAAGGLAAGMGFSYISDEGDLDLREREAAQQAAESGAGAALEHGWHATTRVEKAEIAVWRSVVDVAHEIDASLIVCGARGLNAVKRSLLGSVSEAVLHHGDRPTLITTQHGV